jgi:integrase
LYKDGFRRLGNGDEVQRNLCRDCGYRFSEKPLQKNHECSINIPNTLLFSSQICAELEAKNLVFAQKTKICAGDKQPHKPAKPLPPDAADLITQLMAWLEKECYAHENSYPTFLRSLVRQGANLHDPENVKEVIGKMKCKNGTKMLYSYAYKALADMLKIPFERPKNLKQEDFDPYIPDESELDALINAALTKRMATYLQTLKETFADPGEALRIKWIDVNEKNSTVKINYPVKGHNARTLEVSNKLIAMLNALPKTSGLVFPIKYSSMLNTYVRLRKRVAELQQNPRIQSVELRSFRHWGGTMLAWKSNGNVLLVKNMLGHKNIKNTMRYIGKIIFKDDDYETTAATTLEEVLALGKAGWIKYDEITVGGTIIHAYKKPKKFQSIAV